MSDDRMSRLLDLAASGAMSRREVFRRATALGMSAPVVAAMLAAMEPTGADAQEYRDTSNPLGVDPAAPLEVVIFKGGFGDDYAINVNGIYNELYPDAQINYTGTQRLGPQYQPRFVSGNPPDVMDNSGAENLDEAALVAEGQLADLADLMAAPAFDTEGATFADTLVPGSQETGVYEGQQLALRYALTVYGVWYDQNLFAEHGWTYPKTWDEMLALCEEIKAAGIAPWTYQGQYPQYMRLLFDQMLAKHAGMEALIKIDNLEPDAWKQEAVADVLNAFKQLADGGYILEGTEALSHTESQAEWLQHRAAFIPCGTWLENEMKDLIPEGFQMVVAPSPSLSGDVLPFEAVSAWAGENFIVPAQGKNVQGGKEWLRILFSKQGARFFSENTKALTVVQGAADDLDLGPAFASAQQTLAAAGENTIQARYDSWYKALGDEAKNQMGELLNGRASVEDVMNAIQEAADAVKNDPAIKKYQR
ncbi:MAG TPA: N-acetylglucosamine/diacetylchitobiose ABC transporter substrate-binding protein [Thermomicrobiales bacterium]